MRGDRTGRTLLTVRRCSVAESGGVGAAERPCASGTRPRAVLLTLLAAALVGLTAGCVATPAKVPEAIRVVASGVLPFQPSNSVWYSSSVVRAKKPFARWEQARDRIELVTWPRSCAQVPVAIVFTPGRASVRVETGRAPRSVGPRQCSPGRVLTSTFAGPREMRRDRTTALVLDGRRVLLPPAPGMRVERVALDVRRPGDPHPLRQMDRPLPQYSVRDYPWSLTAPLTAASRTIGIGWIGGTCGPNASIVYVVETSTTVTIDTALAPPPARPARPDRSSTTFCAGVGKSLSATVHLHRPLGSRTLLQHQYVPRPADQNAF